MLLCGCAFSPAAKTHIPSETRANARIRAQKDDIASIPPKVSESEIEFHLSVVVRCVCVCVLVERSYLSEGQQWTEVGNKSTRAAVDKFRAGNKTLPNISVTHTHTQARVYYGVLRQRYWKHKINSSVIYRNKQ